MINLKQRGRAGLQFLGTLQKFSSSALRDQAEADFAVQPENAALTEEFKSDVKRHNRYRAIRHCFGHSRSG